MIPQRLTISSFPVASSNDPAQRCSLMSYPVEVERWVATRVNSDIQLRLSRFVQSCLAQSYSKNCSTSEALQLLDEAWKAQKLLWQIRREAE